MNPVAARAGARYAEHSVTTASPARLVVMLYERLARDLQLAATAIDQGDLEAANRLMKHAQEIVLELRSSLDTSTWEGAAELGRIYDFLHDEMVAANVAKDAPRVRACLDLVRPLLTAWSDAAAQVGIGAA